MNDPDVIPLGHRPMNPEVKLDRSYPAEECLGEAELFDEPLSLLFDKDEEAFFGYRGESHKQAIEVELGIVRPITFGGLDHVTFTLEEQEFLPNEVRVILHTAKPYQDRDIAPISTEIVFGFFPEVMTVGYKFGQSFRWWEEGSDALSSFAHHESVRRGGIEEADRTGDLSL